VRHESVGRSGGGCINFVQSYGDSALSAGCLLSGQEKTKGLLVETAPMSCQAQD